MNRTRDIKALARQRIFRKYGTLAGATAIVGAIYIAIFMAIFFVYSLNLLNKGVLTSVEAMEEYMNQTATSYSYNLIFEAVLVLVGAIMSTAIAGVQYMCLRVARGQDIKVSDMLYAIKNNPDKVIIIFLVQQLLMFLFNLPANIFAIKANGLSNPGVWEILYFVTLMLGYISDVIIIALFSQAIYIYIDNPLEKTTTCMEASINVMKKNMGKYILLMLSFIPMYIVAAFTLGVLYLWLLPYQYTAYALFYMKLKGELGSTIDVTVE